MKKSPLFPALLAFGLVISLLGCLLDLPHYLEIWSIKTTAPASYEFKGLDHLLGKYVKNGLVDYAGLQKDPELAAVYAELERTSPAGLKGRLEELCFWLNAYHLLVIKNIVEQYPTEKMAARSSNKTYIIGAKLYSLAQIKDEILQEQILSCDCRAVFLVCNGELSAPELANHAYSPGSVGDDIDAAYKRFVLSKANYHVNVQKKDFSISPFYLWNHRYFIEKYGSAFKMVNENLPVGKQLNLDAVTQSYGMPYDHRINDLALLNQAKKELLRKSAEETQEKMGNAEDKQVSEDKQISEENGSSDKVEKDK